MARPIIRTLRKNIDDIMKKFLRVIADVLLWIWQLPQHLLGILVYLGCVFCANIVLEKKVNRVSVLYSSAMKARISLGQYIVMGYYYRNLKQGEIALKHELGHSKQSLYLGPLYLLVVGIPSFVWLCLNTYCERYKKKDYYSFYTEKWADRLGGVKRA